MAATDVQLSAEDNDFLAKCEEELKDRFTEKDEEFMKVFNMEPSIPPIVESWWVPNNAGRRNDRRNNRRNHPYERQGGRDHERHGGRRDNFDDRRDRSDRGGNHERRGYNDYNRGYEDRRHEGYGSQRSRY